VPTGVCVYYTGVCVFITAGPSTKLIAFWYSNSKFCTVVKMISTMVLIFGTKVVPVTALYHYTDVFPPMSVRVNYFKYTTVGTLVCIVVFITAVLVYFRRCVFLRK
jgi:hypothetical protein